MASEQGGTLLRSVRTLFGAGTVGELTDAQLLERFLSGHDGQAEMAFEALVTRHGSMVLDVCRNVLRDAHDAQDAFQATFLILARRAKTIRRRDSVASWLFGVARRVASRAKSEAARRRDADRKAAEAKAMEPERGGEPVDFSALHEEIARLPRKYREPVVLCYLEGMTYEAAAQRLGCPLGTVSVRLRRARERLRSRLTRRGLAVPSWLLAATFTPEAVSATLPAPLVAATVQVATQVAATGTVAQGLISASAVLLTEGVLRTMDIAKLKVVAFGSALACLTLAVGTGIIVGQQAAAPQTGSPPTAAKGPAPAENPEEIDAGLKRLVEAARRHADAQQLVYEGDRAPAERYLNALTKLLHAELRVATTADERVAAAKAHLERVKKVEQREQRRVEGGRAIAADVTEVVIYREEAELELGRAQTSSEPATLDALDRRLSKIERRLDALFQVLDNDKRKR